MSPELTDPDIQAEGLPPSCPIHPELSLPSESAWTSLTVTPR